MNDHAKKPPTNAESSPTRLRLSRGIAFVAIAATLCGLDLVTKSLVFAWRGLPGATPVWVIPNHLGFETSINRGALFGMGQGQTLLFVALSILSILGIAYWVWGAGGWRERSLTYVLAAIVGGIGGNLYDRLGLWHSADTPEKFHHGVRDWILFQLPEVPLKILNPWPNFNLADSWIVCGVVFLFVSSLWSGDKPK